MSDTISLYFLMIILATVWWMGQKEAKEALGAIAVTYGAM